MPFNKLDFFSETNADVDVLQKLTRIVWRDRFYSKRMCIDQQCLTASRRVIFGYHHHIIAIVFAFSLLYFEYIVKIFDSDIKLIVVPHIAIKCICRKNHWGANAKRSLSKSDFMCELIDFSDIFDSIVFFACNFSGINGFILFNRGRCAAIQSVSARRIKCGKKCFIFFFSHSNYIHATTKRIIVIYMWRLPSYGWYI